MRKMLRLLLTATKELFWIAVAVALVWGGILGFQYLGENREIVEASPAPRPVALVETVSLEPLTGNLPIRGEGFVRPLRQLSLSSQVSGRVAYVHPTIHERGQFAVGTVLIRLDDRSAAAALEQAEASITATQARIDQNTQDITRIRQLVERGASTRTQLDDLLSLQDELQANMTGYTAARLSAEISQQDRTVTAPFDGAVLAETVEVGDVVSPGQSLATIFTEGELEIDVPVRQADAALIPDLFEGGQASATVDVPFADYTFRWNGVVTRVQPELDPVTRTLAVTLRLTDLQDVEGRALQGGQLASGAPPALINAYASVTIEGAPASDTYVIPSTALRSDNDVWIYDAGMLRTTRVTPVHIDGEDTYIAVSDLAPGTRVITSALSAPVVGMPLRDVTDRRQAELTE